MNKVTGFLLILLGLVLFIFKSKWIPLVAFFNWYFVLTIIGLFLIFFAFTISIAPIALIGGVITTLGLNVWGSRYIEGWPTHYSILLVMLGIAFLLQFTINKGTLSGMISSILLLFGFFTWPGIQNLPGLSPIAHILSTYWPIFIIALGLIMIRK
jgi:hypothetical protein